MALKRTASVVLSVPTAKKARKMSRKKSSRAAYKLSNRSKGPMPSEFVTQLSYAAQVETTAGTPIWVFRMNSLFDPDRTGVGHQPYGRDQLANIYNRYRVNGFKYEVWGANASGGTNHAINIHAVPVDEVASAAAFTSAIQCMEQPGSKTAIATCSSSTAAVGGEAAYVTGYIDLAHLTGRSKAQYRADDRYQSEMGDNPAEAMDFFVAATNIGTGSYEEGAFTVKLTYFVELFDSKVLPTS